MAQERLCSGASLSCMGPLGPQPSLITPTRALTPSAAAGTRRSVSWGVQRMRVGGSARAVRGNCPRQPGLVGAWCCQEMLAGAHLAFSRVCLALSRALPQPCLVTRPLSVPLILPANGREVQDIKVLWEREQSSGALGCSWSASPCTVHGAWVFSPR